MKIKSKPYFKFIIVMNLVIFVMMTTIGLTFSIIDKDIIFFLIFSGVCLAGNIFFVFMHWLGVCESFTISDNSITHKKYFEKNEYLFEDLEYCYVILRRIGRVYTYKKVNKKEVWEYEFAFMADAVNPKYVGIDTVEFKTNENFLFSLKVSDETIQIIEKMFKGKLFLIKELEEKNSIDYNKIRGISNIAVKEI